MQNEEKTPPNLFEYSDYRTFLKDSLSWKRSKNPNLTLQSFALKMGLSGNSSIIKVLKGQRSAGPKIVKRFVRYFEFSEKEEQYFKELVEISKFKTDSVKHLGALERLKKLTSSKVYRRLEDSEFSAISNWWFYAIRQMTKLKDFDPNPAAIKQRLSFPCKIGDIREAIKSMLKLGLLSQDKNSQALVLGTQALSTRSEMANEARKRFHAQMLENARLSIRNTPVSKRFLLGYTIGIDKTRYEEAIQELDLILENFCTRFESKSPDEVYHLQTQFFPLTTTRKEDFE